MLVSVYETVITGAIIFWLFPHSFPISVTVWLNKYPLSVIKSPTKNKGICNIITKINKNAIFFITGETVLFT